MKQDNNGSAKREFQYTIASVDRAMELLLILEDSPRDMGITELSKILGVQKSTVHNLVQTLMVRDFVRQTDSGRYTLGFKLMRLGQASADRLDIRRLAYPALNELANEANEYVLFAVMNRDELMIVENVAPPRPTFLVPRFDYCHTFHSSALGKVFLAFGPDERRNLVFGRSLTKYTPYTITDVEALAGELDKIREQGYAVSCNETIEGVVCIGAPVFNAHGKLEAAVSVSSASALLPIEKYETMAKILIGKAGRISRLLGY